MNSEKVPPLGAPEDLSPEPQAAPTRAPAWWRLGTAITGLTAVAVTAAAVLLLPDAVPGQAAAASQAQAIEVAPSGEQWVCPGPAKLADPTAVGDAQFSASPVETTSTLGAFALPAGSSAGLSDLSGAPTATLAEGSGAAAAAGTAGVDGAVLTATATSESHVHAVAGVSSMTEAGDLRGLVAATCTVPGVSRWLVGGSTEVGSSAQLVIQNPGATPATVRTEVWGPDGPVVLGSGAVRVIAPGTQSVTLLEGSAPGQARIAVHVTSTGGMVGAYIQHNSLDGLVPLGVDDVMPGAEPSTKLALTGIAATGLPVDDPHAPRLRLLAPEATTARIVVLGPDGQVRLRGAEEIGLPAGVVTDVSLGGLAAGMFGVAIESDAPVVAGALIDRQGGSNPDLPGSQNQYDRAWITAQALPADGAGVAGLDLGGVALVPGASSTIAIAAVPAGTLDPQDSKDPTGRFVGTLTAYDAAGNTLGSTGVEAKTGAVVTVDAASIVADAAAPPAMVTLVGAEGVSDGVPAWSVLAAAGPTDGSSQLPTLISVLEPALPVDSGRTVVVQADDSLTLPH